MKKSIIAIAFVLVIGTAIGVAAGGGPAKTTVHTIDWYNSFADAKKQAKAEGKPILLLSMFGKLDEEMPCANARTLRATLFKDPDFQNLVTKDVVPAWEMVREVPRIKIDLGDGKEVTRTVRGNAVMYLCNSDGKVIDAYPGIYTKGDFMPVVKESIAKLGKATEAEVIAYHKAAPSSGTFNAYTTLSKGVLEGPILNAIGAKPIKGANPPTLAEQVTPEKQRFLRQARRVVDVSLTPATADEAVRAATGKGFKDIPADNLAETILQNDSKRNMNRLRPVIHLWFASETKLPTPMEARETVLATILKIPYKDPYFGLKDVLLPGTPE